MGHLGQRQLMSGLLVASAGIGGRLLTVGITMGGTSIYGFVSSTGIGSLTPTEFLSSNINQVKWLSTNVLVLAIDDTAHANSGWSTININGNVFNRSDASYSAGGWTWAAVSNPMNVADGSVVPVNIA
jgi:hypothetical protein